MDSYREHPSDFELAPSGETPVPDDVTSAIGTDERRMHVRAYNHWVSLLNGRDFPSIEDLEPSEVSDFAANSVLLDFTCGGDNPAVPYIGGAIRDECGLDDDARTIADVPSRSLLSRLTDHYLQIIANRAPIGFEAEFANQRDETICYRGILMPFSSDGETIDFIYGVINWKRVGAEASADQPAATADLPEIGRDSIVETTSDAADEPLELTSAVDETFTEVRVQPQSGIDAPEAPVPHFSWEDGPLADAEEAEVPQIELAADAGLADRLWAARETAEAVKAGEGRTRAALYQALSLAYDFALAADRNPTEYAEVLAESGVKAQARAPMTAIVKLVFGIDYDKARLTEFAAALSYAARDGVEAGAFEKLIQQQPGGLKGLVAAERAQRRPASKGETSTEAARARLRAAPPLSLAQVPADEEFALIVTRRGPDGRHEPVAIVADEALIDRAIRRIA